MKSFRDRNPYLVGIVSILLLGVVTAGVFAVGLLNVLEQAYEMEANFTDASGLKAGDDVRVAGVKVGRVTEVEADASVGQVRITWVVNNGTEIRDGAGADIALATLLGAKYVRITNPIAGTTPFEMLPREQRRIPVERTTVPFDLFELTRVSTNGIEELNTGDLNDFITQLADITDGKQATVADLAEGIKRVGAAINDRDQELDSLLDQAERLGETLNDKDDEILALIDASRDILDLVVKRRNELAVVLGESADAVGELDRLIADNKATIDSALDSLAPTLDVVSRQQDDLDRGLAWLGPALRQQSRGGEQGPWQDIFVRALGPDAVGVLQDVYTILATEPG